MLFSAKQRQLLTLASVAIIHYSHSTAIMRFHSSIRTTQLLGISILGASLTNFVIPGISVAQVCNVFGCSAPGAGPCTVFGCPAPPPQPTPNIIVVPGNTTSQPAANTSRQNQDKVAACTRSLHNFYYHNTSASNSQAIELAQAACQSGASASCIQETYTYYYRQTPASHTESARLAQETCTP